MKKYFLLLSFLFAGIFSVSAQHFPDTIREFRGVWVATTKRIDYPSKATTDAKFLKEEYLSLLEKYKSWLS